MALSMGEGGKEPLHSSCSLLVENKISEAACCLPLQIYHLHPCRSPRSLLRVTQLPRRKAPLRPLPNTLILQLSFRTLRDQSGC